MPQSPTLLLLSHARRRARRGRRRGPPPQHVSADKSKATARCAVARSPSPPTNACWDGRIASQSSPPSVGIRRRVRARRRRSGHDLRPRRHLRVVRVALRPMRLIPAPSSLRRGGADLAVPAAAPATADVSVTSQWAGLAKRAGCWAGPPVRPLFFFPSSFSFSFSIFQTC